jgi:hypothetical protein
MSRAAVRAGTLGVVALALASTAVSLHGQTWRIELGLGTVHNFRTPLTIEQNGFPRIRIDAQYATRGFEVPFYYAVRVERSGSNALWGIEFIHDKIYLENRPPEVQRFDATHGFNILSLVRSSPGDGLRYRLGVGVLLAHVENEIRGQRLSEDEGVRGYHLTGPIAQAGLVWGTRITGNTGVYVDAKLLGGRARFPVAGGHARFFHAGAHFSAGLSQRF